MTLRLVTGLACQDGGRQLKGGARVQAELSAECYNAMLGIVLRGDPDFVSHAMEAVAEMRDKGLRPRTDTFNTIMYAAVYNADFLQVRPCSHA